MTPKKGFQDIIKKFGEKIAGIGSRIKGFFTLNDAEKEAEAVSKKRLSSKPLPKSANKKASDTPTEETVIFTDDMTKRFSSDSVKKKGLCQKAS